MSAGTLSNSEQSNQGRKSIPDVFMEDGRVKQFSSENNQKSIQGHVEKKNPLERSHENVETWINNKSQMSE